MVAGVARFVPRDGVQVVACVCRAAGAYRRSDGRGRRGERAAGLGGWSGVVCLAGRCASCHLCLSRSWCLSLKGRSRTLRRRTKSWTRWRLWCGLSCGTVRKFPLAWGVQLLIIFGVAVADVELDVAVAGVVRFVAWDGAQVAAGVRHAAGACRRSDGRGRCGGRGAGRGGGSGAAYRVGRRARCRLRGTCSLCFCRPGGGRGGAVCPAGRSASCRLRAACSWCMSLE